MYFCVLIYPLVRIICTVCRWSVRSFVAYRSANMWDIQGVYSVRSKAQALESRGKDSFSLSSGYLHGYLSFIHSFTWLFLSVVIQIMQSTTHRWPFLILLLIADQSEVSINSKIWDTPGTVGVVYYCPMTEVESRSLLIVAFRGHWSSDKILNIIPEFGNVSDISVGSLL